MDNRVWNLPLARKAWAAYLSECDGEAPTYAAPATAMDFSNLPPAFVSVEGEDILRDEGIAYAQKLMQAGVSTDLRVYAGAYHGPFANSPEAGVSRQHNRDIDKALVKFMA